MTSAAPAHQWKSSCAGNFAVRPANSQCCLRRHRFHQAGACLISLSTRKDRALLLVVLGSASSTGRYVDSRNLFRWAWQQTSPPAETGKSSDAKAEQ